MYAVLTIENLLWYIALAFHCVDLIAGRENKMSSSTALRQSMISHEQQYYDEDDVFESGLEDSALTMSSDLPMSDTQASKWQSQSGAPQQDSRSYNQSDEHEQSGSMQYRNQAGLSQLEHNLNDLVCLIANLSESYSTVIFRFDSDRSNLSVAAFHTLSRDFLQGAQINLGAGLVGWTAENKVRISVCPFQHDSRTLLYYSTDQSLKSFIAIPIIGSNDVLLGVLCCDSKKSYAFTKLTEKILHDCARQSAILMELHSELGIAKANKVGNPSILSETIKLLRSCVTEEDLLSSACSLPQDVISRDALVVITVADRGVGQGSYYSVSRENRFNHRLLELVCKHKKVLCPNRTVHVAPSDDMKERSFVSIPFQVLGREAGSLNLLSKQSESFYAKDIATLEKIAEVIGDKLEHLRLRDRIGGAGEQVTNLSWALFEAKATRLLEDARNTGGKFTLLRLQISSIEEIEDTCGANVSCSVIERVARIVDQVAGQNAVSCCLYGTQFLVLIQPTEVAGFYRKFRTLIDRFDLKDMNGRDLQVGLNLSQFLRQDIRSVSARFPEDGMTMFELMSKTNAVLKESVRQHKSLEVSGDGWS